MTDQQHGTAVTGTARVGRSIAALMPRLGPGDIAVVERMDLDRVTADALVDTGVRIVVAAGPLVAGHDAGAGVERLLHAGVLLVDDVGTDGVVALWRRADGRRVRVVDGVVSTAPGDDEAPDVLASGRPVELRRPELPELRTDLSGRPVVVVARPARSGHHSADLRRIAPFVRDRDPVVIAVGPAADDLFARGWVADVVVTAADPPAAVPSADALRTARDVVLVLGPGADPHALSELAELGVEPSVVDATAQVPLSAEDVALLIAEGYDAPLVVGVGLRSEAGSSRLVAPSAVGRRDRAERTRALLFSGAAVTLVAAVLTSVGVGWLADLADSLGHLL